MDIPAYDLTSIHSAPHSEVELRQTLLEYKAILDNASVGVSFTRDRKFLHCNERFSEMFGWPRDELVGKPTHIVYPSEEAFSELGRIAIPVLSSGGRLDVELVMMRRDGATFWCRILGKAIDPTDHRKGTIFIVEDITDRKAADEALHQLLLEQQAILDNALIGIGFLKDRVIVRCNRRLEELFGYGAGELSNVSTRVLYRSQKEFEAAARAYDILAQGGADFREQIMRRKNGIEFWCRTRGNAVETGNPSIGSVWLFEDITERKRTEETLLQVRDELELRVQERTKELAAANGRLQAEIEERRLIEAQVRHMAHHDALTGLPNRRLLEDRLGQAIAMAKRRGCGVAVMFVDLDRFKLVNDSLGHRGGDLLLQAVARRLRGLLREADTVARVGGDEFVVVLSDLREEAPAATVAEKILGSLVQPYVIDGNDLRVTPSIGISLYPKDGTNVETLISHADAAMYHAKQMGRKNYQLFTSDMDCVAANRLQLENDLHRAIERGELLLHFQPKIDLASGRLCGMEALLRWLHPVKGLVPPGDFIPLAEDTGLIVPLGEWVIREACRQTTAWIEQGHPACPIAVNLSARQFRGRDLDRMIAAALGETGLSPALLELEITESTLMHNTEETMATLAKLQAIGLQLSIDDFGTGYSSLNYLKRFRVDKLKIDQSFVRDISSDPDDAAIVSAIIALAQHLKMRVVAEGVETAEQLEFLSGCGCDEAQGYYFSRPRPANEISSLFSGHFAPRASEILA